MSLTLPALACYLQAVFIVSNVLENFNNKLELELELELMFRGACEEEIIFGHTQGRKTEKQNNKPSERR